jgi:hypothetical protein
MVKYVDRCHLVADNYVSSSFYGGLEVKLGI